MKTITKLCILFSLVFSLNANAQKASHKGPLSEDHIINTKKELKRERRIHENSVGVAKSNETFARKKHKLGTKLFHKPGRKKGGAEKTKKG